MIAAASLFCIPAAADLAALVQRLDSWNAELVPGDLEEAVQHLTRQSGKGLFVGGVQLQMSLTELGVIR